MLKSRLMLAALLVFVLTACGEDQNRRPLRTATAVAMLSLTPPIPTPTIPPTSTLACPPPEGWQAYEAVVGDTLDSIARRTGTTPEDLMTSNCLAGSSLIYAGQTLYVPQTPPPGDPVLAVAQMNHPLIALIQGDLWTWEQATGTLTQITRWGYNERPVMSPDGKQVAYNSWALPAIQAIDRGKMLMGFVPTNIWVWDITDGDVTDVAAQPSQASFMVDGVEDRATMRSTPAWSPDGTALAWTEILLPDYSRRLVVYHLDTGEVKIIQPNLPVPYVDAGNWAIADITWGTTGIALTNSSYNASSGKLEHTVYIYGETGNVIQEQTVDQPIANKVWANDGGKEVLALFHHDGTWSILDPTTGQVSDAPAAPELFSPLVTQSVAPLIFGLDQTDNSRLVWSVISPDRTTISRLGFVGFPPEIAISPDGQKIAYMSDAIYVWQSGRLIRVPNTDTINQQVMELAEPGLVWGPTAWRITTDQPQAGPAETGCAPTPRLENGGMGRVIPGSSNALRSAPGMGSDSTVIGEIPSSGVFEILNGPICASGYNWWQVNTNGAIGWTAEGENQTYWLEPYSVEGCTLPPRLSIGASAQVAIGYPNAIRTAPGTEADSHMVGEIPAGGIFAVLDGPQCANGYNWWQVNYNGAIGWTAEGTAGGTAEDYWLLPLVCPNSPPSRLAPQRMGRVLPGPANVMHGQPGTDAESTALGEIPGGDLFTVVSGPQCDQAGRLWWQVSYKGTLGWIAEGEGQTYWIEPWQG